MKIARPRFARRHDQRRGDAEIVLLQLVFVVRDQRIQLRVGAEDDFAHRTPGLAHVLDPRAGINRHLLKQIRRQFLAGFVGRAMRSRFDRLERAGVGDGLGFARDGCEQAQGYRAAPSAPLRPGGLIRLQNLLHAV